MSLPITRYYKKSTYRRTKSIYGVGILLIVVLAGTLLRDAALGTALIVAYGVISLAVKVPSVETLKMATLLFPYIILLVFLKNKELAENFAQYAFLLLCFAILSAFRELILEGRSKRVVKKVNRVDSAKKLK